MIPEKKKTADELAALREGLGIPPVPAPAATLPPVPAALPEVVVKAEEPTDSNAERVIHLDPQPTTTRPEKPEFKPVHSLRKHELPLAPAPASPSPHRTALPAHRHDLRDVAEIRKREALAALRQAGSDPAAHIRRQIASPFLYVPGYLLAIAAAVTAYQRVHYITPATLVGLASVIMIFIALRKPRSRHHAALLFIVVFLTLVFGALHYAPLFRNGP